MQIAEVTVDPKLAVSRRVRIFGNHAVARMAARALVHVAPGLWGHVSGSYAGPARIRLAGATLNYVLGSGDTIGDILFWQGERHWEWDVTPVFAGIAQKAQGLFLDVGANFGIYSLLACALNPELRVVAWEPVPFINERMKLNARQNGFGSRIDCRQAAVAEEKGAAVFFAHEDATMGSLSDRSGHGQPFSVPLESVDDVIAPGTPIGLVKIDVEGHEVGALKGMRRILAESHPPIIFECLDAQAWHPLEAFLKGYGYSICSISGNVRAAAQFRDGVTNYLAKHE